MNKSQAINSFWSGFGLNAFDESTVLGEDIDPNDRPKFPFITYNVSLGDFDSEVVMSASLWYKTMSWKDISDKADEISKYISRGGIRLPIDNGMIWIKKMNPFSQRMSEETSSSVRRILMTISVEFITED